MPTDTERPMTAVLSDIVGNVQQIIRAEVRLAKVELGDELRKFKRGALLVASGCIALMLALGLVLLAGVYALTLVWPPWAAALAVAGVTAGVGAAIAAAGLTHLKHDTPPLRKSAAIMEEHIQWAKTRVR